MTQPQDPQPQESQPEDYGSRKDAHIRLAVDSAAGHANDFDDLRFVHHSLAAIDAADVSLRASYAGIPTAVPLYINAMTGGSDKAERINGALAAVARDLSLPMATGSMSAFLKDPSAARTYAIIRETNPSGVLIANVNANASPGDARRAVELIGADALQIHLNSVQEIVMPEGDRSFRHWPDAIAAIASDADVPVIVKDVGFGISAQTYRLLAELGVSAVDLAGRGGTDFAAIENQRRDHRDFAYMAGWGQSAASGLIEVERAPSDPPVLASGGVRNPLDVAKSLALGAESVGVAGHFLRILVNDGADELRRVVRAWLEQLGGLMTILGAPSVADLRRTDIVVTGALAERSRARGADVSRYARRSQQR